MPKSSVSKTWARQSREESKRYQVSIHNSKYPTRVFDTLTQAKALIARVKSPSLAGVHWDIYDRETGEFKASGVFAGKISNPAKGTWIKVKAIKFLGGGKIQVMK